MVPCNDPRHIINEYLEERLRKWLENVYGPYANTEEVMEYDQMLPGQNYLFTGGLFGNDNVDPQSSEKRKPHEPSWEEIYDWMDKIFHTVVEIIGKNRTIRLSDQRFNREEIRAIIAKVRNLGLDIHENDFEDIILIAQGARNWIEKGKRPNLIHSNDICRYVSLNSFDCDILVKETEKLADQIGAAKFEHECRTLYSLRKLIVDTPEGNYPLRKYDIHRLKGPSAQRFQFLHMMDELLYTTGIPTEHESLNKTIKEKAKDKQLDINWEEYTYEDFISPSLAKSLYRILGLFVRSGIRPAEGSRYSRVAFEWQGDGEERRRFYAKIHNNERVCAFRLNISWSEIKSIRKQTGCIRVNYFDDDQEMFAQEFPLISKIARLEFIALEIDSEDGDFSDIFKIRSTDFMLINYERPLFPELLEAADDAVEKHKTIVIVHAGKSYRVKPIRVEKRGLRWSLIARDTESNLLMNLSPKELEEALSLPIGHEADMESWDYDHRGTEDFNQSGKYYIGISPFKPNEPIKAALNLKITRKIKAIAEEYPMLKPLGFQILNHLDTYGNGRWVGITVYPNQDFFDELWALDRAGKLKAVKSPELSEKYMEYLDEWAKEYFKGKKRTGTFYQRYLERKRQLIEDMKINE